MVYSDSFTVGNYIETLLFDAKGRLVRLKPTGIVYQRDTADSKKTLKMIRSGFVIGKEYSVEYLGKEKPVRYKLRYNYDVDLEIPDKFMGGHYRPTAFKGTIESPLQPIVWQ